MLPEDVEVAANSLGVDAQSFIVEHCLALVEEHVYTNETINVGSFALGSNEDRCSMLHGNDCSIHSAKPLVCRLAPFSYTHWGNPTIRTKYEKESPGFGQGRDHTVTEIAARMAAERSAWLVYRRACSIANGAWWRLYGFERRPEIAEKSYRKEYPTSYPGKGRVS